MARELHTAYTNKNQPAESRLRPSRVEEDGVCAVAFAVVAPQTKTAYHAQLDSFATRKDFPTQQALVQKVNFLPNFEMVSGEGSSCGDLASRTLHY